MDVSGYKILNPIGGENFALNQTIQVSIQAGTIDATNDRVGISICTDSNTGGWQNIDTSEIFTTNEIKNYSYTFSDAGWLTQGDCWIKIYNFDNQAGDFILGEKFQVSEFGGDSDQVLTLKKANQLDSVEKINYTKIDYDVTNKKIKMIFDVNEYSGSYINLSIPVAKINKSDYSVTSGIKEATYKRKSHYFDLRPYLNIEKIVSGSALESYKSIVNTTNLLQITSDTAIIVKTICLEYQYLQELYFEYDQSIIDIEKGFSSILTEYYIPPFESIKEL